MHSKFRERGDDRVNALREFSGERSRGAARRLRARCVDEVRHALGLREVHAAVEERSARELPGLGDARAQLDAAAHQLPQHDGAAVTLELDDVLARVRMRGRKEERDAAIDQGAVAVAEIGKRRMARHGHRPGDSLHDGAGALARDAHDPDPATAGRRGNRGDGVAAAQRRAFAAASAANVLLMCHCCRIDSRFCTTQ